jgi:hypothetical protein
MSRDRLRPPTGSDRAGSADGAASYNRTDPVGSGRVPGRDVSAPRPWATQALRARGHCSRLPQEGPCECDLYLNCAKFVTTREYAPRPGARWRREQVLAADAAARGWERERERMVGRLTMELEVEKKSRPCSPRP